MSDIIERLRQRAPELADEVIAHVTELNERIKAQHVIMDKAASIMVEAVSDDNGIDSEQADACIDQIRGLFTEMGKTTAEHYLGLLYARVGQIAGIPPDDEFDVMAELDKLGESVEGLKWAMSVLWRDESPGDTHGGRMVEAVGCLCCGDAKGFPRGTTWQEALKILIAEETARSAPAAST